MPETGEKSLYSAMSADINQSGPDVMQEQNQMILAAYFDAPFGVHLYRLNDDEQLVFAGANNTADNLLKIEHETLIGQFLPDVFRNAKSSDLFENLTEIAKNGSTWISEVFDYQDDRISGAFLILAYRPIPGTLLTIIADASELMLQQNLIQRKQEQLDIILNSANIGIWDYDLKNGILEIMGQGLITLGYDAPRLSVSTEQWLAMIHPLQREDVARSFQAHLEGRSIFFDKEYQVRSVSGNYYWISIRGKVVERDRSGIPVRATGIHEDINNRKKREEQIRLYHERMYQYQSTLLSLSTHRALRIGNFAQAARTITSAVADILRADRVSIWLVNGSRDQLVSVDLYNRPQETHTSGDILTPSTNPNYFMALDAGRYIAANDARHDPRTKDFTASYLEPNDIYSLLDTPIRIEGEVAGTVSIENTQTLRKWDESEISFVGQVGDLTAQALSNARRREAEEALRESEEKLRSFMESVDDSVYFQRLDGAVEHLTSVDSKTTGYSREEYKNDPQLWEKIIHPDDFRIAKDFFQSKAGKVDRFDILFRLKHKSGDWRWIQSRMVGAKDKQGKITGYNCVDRDVTNLKTAEEEIRQSESRFRMLFENSEDAIYIRVGRQFVMVSPSFERLFGYDASEITSEGFDSSVFIAEKDRDVVLGHLEAYDKGELGTIEESFTGVRKDGQKIEVDLRVSRLEWDGAPAIMGIIRDVSERRRLEAQLLRSQKMEAVGRLAGGIAHDFNNLLTAISGNAELAQLQLHESDPLFRYVNDITKTTTRGAALTRQLLAFSRKQVAEPRLTNLNTILTNMEYMLRRLIGEDIRFVLQKDTELGQILIDPVQLEQIIVNLVVNARDAMPEGGRLAIESSNVDVDKNHTLEHLDAKLGPHVLLTVQDTGCGIPAEILDNVFEPFFTTKGESEGTGLGLSTVYGIVRQNGGHIDLKSTLNEGTIFNIYLPRVQAKEVLEENAHITRKESLKGNETILVVEDEEAVLQMTSQLLTHYGYHIITARDATTALQEVQSSKGKTIDLILTDVIMPDMNGPELAENLAVSNPDIKVIYMSGYTENEIIKKGLSDVNFSYIQKPFRSFDLISLVRETLEKR